MVVKREAQCYCGTVPTPFFIRLGKALRGFSFWAGNSTSLSSHTLFQKVALPDPMLQHHEFTWKIRESCFALCQSSWSLNNIIIYNEIGPYIYLDDCIYAIHNIYWYIFRLFICVNILFLRLIINNFPIRVLLLSFCPYSFGVFYLTATVQFLFLHALSYPQAKYGRSIFIICIREWKSTLSFGLVFIKWDTTMTTKFFFNQKSSPSTIPLTELALYI